MTDISEMFETDTKARCFKRYPIYADVPAGNCAGCSEQSDCGKTEDK